MLPEYDELTVDDFSEPISEKKEMKDDKTTVWNALGCLFVIILIKTGYFGIVFLMKLFVELNG